MPLCHPSLQQWTDRAPNFDPAVYDSPDTSFYSEGQELQFQSGTFYDTNILASSHFGSSGATGEQPSQTRGSHHTTGNLYGYGENPSLTRSPHYYLANAADYSLDQSIYSPTMNHTRSIEGAYYPESYRENDPVQITGYSDITPSNMMGQTMGYPQPAPSDETSYYSSSEYNSDYIKHYTSSDRQSSFNSGNSLAQSMNAGWEALSPEQQLYYTSCNGADDDASRQAFNPHMYRMDDER